MSAPEAALRVRADRRTRGAYEAVLDAFTRVAEGIEGVRAVVRSRADFDAAPDEGAFRDFVEVGVLYHVALEPLEYAAEWLIDELDWMVDVGRPAF